MDHLLASVFLLLSSFIITAASSAGGGNRLATPDILSASSVIETATSFAKETITVETNIPFATTYQEDPEMEYGTEKTISPGQAGTKIETFEVTFWEEIEIDRRLIDTEVTPPRDEIVLNGTKLVWRDLPTPDQGVLRYWHNLNVRATSYDANCIGCTGRTFTGTEVHHGVCATDPQVIPLGTTFYVPGYGLCRAEDIGGAIKGNKIDLGWEDVRFGWWSTRWVDIYLIDNAPY
ncbi:G5 domain-containing protein [Candidatus Parcubacteria bacterium]|nr:G5 domain-containing protein [Candidatus Parcubacteria bacterium]